MLATAVIAAAHAMSASFTLGQTVSPVTQARVGIAAGHGPGGGHHGGPRLGQQARDGRACALVAAGHERSPAASDLRMVTGIVSPFPRRHVPQRWAHAGVGSLRMMIIRTMRSSRTVK